MVDTYELIRTISIWAIPVLLAITFHEAAHGYVAKIMGDKTAYMLGRVTLNPFSHIDLFGTILMPLALAIMGAPMLGYAKPVPVNYRNLCNQKWAVVAVAMAGVGANFLLIIISAILLRFLILLAEPSTFTNQAAEVLVASLQINAILMVFNLFPILPLDGGRVVSALLPPKLAYKFSRLEPYGMYIIIAALIIPYKGSSLLFAALHPLLNKVFILVNYLLPSGM